MLNSKIAFAKKTESLCSHVSICLSFWWYFSQIRCFAVILPLAGCFEMALKMTTVLCECSTRIIIIDHIINIMKKHFALFVFRFFFLFFFILLWFICVGLFHSVLLTKDREWTARSGFCTHWMRKYNARISTLKKEVSIRLAVVESRIQWTADICWGNTSNGLYRGFVDTKCLFDAGVRRDRKRKTEKCQSKSCCYRKRCSCRGDDIYNFLPAFIWVCLFFFNFFFFCYSRLDGVAYIRWTNMIFFFSLYYGTLHFL